MHLRRCLFEDGTSSLPIFFATHNSKEIPINSTQNIKKDVLTQMIVVCVLITSYVLVFDSLYALKSHKVFSFITLLFAKKR